MFCGCWRGSGPKLQTFSTPPIALIPTSRHGRCPPWLRLLPIPPKCTQILAQTLASQDNFSGAIAQYRKALETDPQLPGVHFDLGQVILANSQEEPARKEAEKEFALALAADPTNADSEYMLGEVEWLRSNPQGAL